MTAIKERIDEVLSLMDEKFNLKNRLAAPRLVKVVISSGAGTMRDAKRRDFIIDRLTRIAGQRASVRGAKKSIAGFKIRQGDSVGAVVTLRGKIMYDFLDKLINIAIPRMRDFQGIPESGVDDVGNLTIGIPEHTIFPETSDEDLRDVFGLSVTIVTTAKKREVAVLFLKHIGFPIKQD